MSKLLTIERVATLQRVSLFGDVPGHTLVAVARLLEEVPFEEGDAIILENDLPDLYEGSAGVFWKAGATS